MKKKAFVAGMTGALPLGLVAALISLKFHFFILVWLIYIVFTLLGTIYGAAYIRQGKANEDWLKQLFWSNTATWLIPPLGFFTASSTGVINHVNKGNDYNLFRRLANFCFFASLVSATILVGLVVHH
jgi:hypothetical protein